MTEGSGGGGGSRQETPGPRWNANFPDTSENGKIKTWHFVRKSLQTHKSN